MVCDRVAIVDRGRVVRSGRLTDLIGGVPEIRVTVDRVDPGLLELLSALGTCHRAFRTARSPWGSTTSTSRRNWPMRWSAAATACTGWCRRTNRSRTCSSAWCSRRATAKRLCAACRCWQRRLALEPDDLGWDSRKRSGIVWPRPVVMCSRRLFDALEAGGDQNARVHAQGVQRADERKPHLAAVGVTGQDQVGAELARLEGQVGLVDQRQAGFVGRVCRASRPACRRGPPRRNRSRRSTGSGRRDDALAPLWSTVMPAARSASAMAWPSSSPSLRSRGAKACSSVPSSLAPAAAVLLAQVHWQRRVVLVVAEHDERAQARLHRLAAARRPCGCRRPFRTCRR